MKISKIFHWLYFTVMMLPCVIIPIFAIYTRNENYNSNIEIEVQENKVVNFNQLITDDKSYVSNPNNQDFIAITYLNMLANHKYYLRFEPPVVEPQSTRYYQFYIDGGNLGTSIFNVVSRTFEFTTDTNCVLRYHSYVVNGSRQDYDGYVNFFDLTQMFGSGNEPSMTQFDYYFQEQNYNYTIGTKVLIEGYTETYNDTDVGSQFVYTLYNATDKYFNFDNFFGLDNVYSWIQLNWFSGNAPLGFAIFWHFFTYWLLASLAWLLFDLMVYVPLFIHRWLDKGAIE